MPSSAWVPGLQRSRPSPGGRDGVSRLRHGRGTGGIAPQQGETSPGGMKLHCTPPQGHPPPAKETYISASVTARGKGSEQEHARNLA